MSQNNFSFLHYFWDIKINNYAFRIVKVMVIGGGEIYKTLFDKASRIYMTRVEAEPEADTFFPSLHPKDWHLISQQIHEADEKNAYNYSFQLWERLG